MRRDERGSSLAEVLVGLLLLSMTLLTVIPMFTIATHSVAAARDRTVASLLVQSKAEELRATDWSDLAAGSDDDTVVLGTMTYQRSWTVVDGTPHAGLKEITITVTPQRAVRLLAPRSEAEVTFHAAR